MFEKLPQWKDENPVQYEKQQIKTRLAKLRWDPNKDPAEIKALEERYAVLDEPQREKRREAAKRYFADLKNRKGKSDI